MHVHHACVSVEILPSKPAMLPPIPDGVLVCSREQGPKCLEGLLWLLLVRLKLGLEQQRSWAVRLTGQQTPHLQAVGRERAAAHLTCC